MWYDCCGAPFCSTLVCTHSNHMHTVALGAPTSYAHTDPIPAALPCPSLPSPPPQMHRSAPPVVGPNPLPDLNHMVLAMEGVDYFHPDLYTFAVMNSLMGGGGSFSAGGPGKGMYSQLYLNVLNQHHLVYSALAQNFSSSDAGLFCLFGSAAPSDVRACI